MADQEDQTTKISEFSSITGVDRDRAKFYLQSSNWELSVALGTFYDSNSEESQYAENPEPVDISHQEQSTEGDINLATPPIASPMENVTGSKEQSQSSRNKKGSSNIFSLSSYHQADDESGNSDTEEGQAYYAGGSEHSGQQILGPDKHKKSKNPTGNLFDAAKKHGASVVSESREDSSSKKRSYFCGAGFTLGSDVEPSQQVGSPLSASEVEKPQTVVIKFWSNGFSIDNGPLRDFNDPDNKSFLDSIAKGEVPAELRRHARNAEVHVNMEDHREEEYVKPKETLKAFSGEGYMLGSPMPNIVSDTSTPAPDLSDRQTSVYQVDESKPTTSIQIRLADGTRLVTKFNHDSSIGDIRNVVRNARPNTGNFNLMTTFPNKVLSDDKVTISDAKLLNAVIVQRMT